MPAQRNCVGTWSGKGVDAVPTLTQLESSLSSFSLQACVNNASASCLVDIGPAVSLISHCPWEKLLETNTELTLETVAVS